MVKSLSQNFGNGSCCDNCLPEKITPVKIYYFREKDQATGKWQYVNSGAGYCPVHGFTCTTPIRQARAERARQQVGTRNIIATSECMQPGRELPPCGPCSTCAHAVPYDADPRDGHPRIKCMNEKATGYYHIIRGTDQVRTEGCYIPRGGQQLTPQDVAQLAIMGGRQDRQPAPEAQPAGQDPGLKGYFERRQARKKGRK
jgi:hypothetical protein